MVFVQVCCGGGDGDGGGGDEGDDVGEDEGEGEGEGDGDGDGDGESGGEGDGGGGGGTRRQRHNTAPSVASMSGCVFLPCTYVQSDKTKKNFIIRFYDGGAAGGAGRMTRQKKD